MPTPFEHYRPNPANPLFAGGQSPEVLRQQNRNRLQQGQDDQRASMRANFQTPDNQRVVLHQSMEMRLRNMRAALAQNRDYLTVRQVDTPQGQRTASSILGAMDLAENSSSTETAIQSMIEGATAELPAIPQGDEQLEQLDNISQRYFSARRETLPGDSLNRPIYVVSVNMHAIRQDQAIIEGLKNRFAQNPANITALNMLEQALEQVARQDPQSYMYHQMVERQENNGSTKGLATMGKLAAGIAIGLYALTDTAIALANKRMPTAGLLVALGGATLLHKPYRRAIFGPAEIAILENVDTVLDNDAFKKYFDPTYKIYELGRKWEPIFEEWMTNPGETQTFLRNLDQHQGNAEAQEKIVNEYLADIGADDANPIRPLLRSMITTQYPEGADPLRTDFKVLLSLIRGKNADTRQVILAAIRTDRGRRSASSMPPTAPAPARPGTTVI